MQPSAFNCLDTEAPAATCAYALARIAKAAYADDPVAAHEEALGSFSRVETFRDRRIFGMVAGNDRDVVIAFRGTHEDREWLEALTFGQTAWVAGRAHSGLTRLLDSVWSRLLASLFDVGADARRVWLTGHSIGGGLALLAALRLEHEGFDVECAATFGAPAVLDATAVDTLRMRVLRVVNNEDIVPELSWPTLVDTYVHAGERILLMPSGAIAATRHTPRLARRIDRAFTIGDGPQPAGPLHDHSLQAYIDKLGRHIV